MGYPPGPVTMVCFSITWLFIYFCHEPIPFRSESIWFENRAIQCWHIRHIGGAQGGWKSHRLVAYGLEQARCRQNSKGGFHLQNQSPSPDNVVFLSNYFHISIHWPRYLKIERDKHDHHTLCPIPSAHLFLIPLMILSRDGKGCHSNTIFMLSGEELLIVVQQHISFKPNNLAAFFGISTK